MVSAEYLRTLYKSCQPLGPHSIAKLDPVSYLDPRTMTWTHLSAEPNPQHHQVDGFSHLDAFYGVQVATAMLGSAKTLHLFPRWWCYCSYLTHSQRSYLNDRKYGWWCDGRFGYPIRYLGLVDHRDLIRYCPLLMHLWRIRLGNRWSDSMAVLR